MRNCPLAVSRSCQLGSQQRLGFIEAWPELGGTLKFSKRLHWFIQGQVRAPEIKVGLREIGLKADGFLQERQSFVVQPGLTERYGRGQQDFRISGASQLASYGDGVGLIVGEQGLMETSQCLHFDARLIFPSD